MSLFGMPKGVPCCCSSGCCPGVALPDCITFEIESSCCPGDVHTVVLTFEGSEASCEGGDRRPFTAAEAFCGGLPDIIYTGALDAAWCTTTDLLDATILVFCCVNPLTGESEWWLYVGGDDASGYNWYPSVTPKYYQLQLISCDPLLLQIGGEAPDCSAEVCTWTWQPACFVEGTMIRTPHGDVQIETLSVGDVILDIHGKEVYVLETIKTEVDHLIQIIDESGVSIGVTPEHPFIDIDMISVIEAKDLEVGQRLPFGKEVASVKLFKAVKEKFKVVNLSVTESNTFVADGFAVHNKGQS